jgi:hypothetical protein
LPVPPQSGWPLRPDRAAEDGRKRQSRTLPEAICSGPRKGIPDMREDPGRRQQPGAQHVSVCERSFHVQPNPVFPGRLHRLRGDLGRRDLVVRVGAMIIRHDRWPLLPGLVRAVPVTGARCRSAPLPADELRRSQHLVSALSPYPVSGMAVCGAWGGDFTIREREPGRNIPGRGRQPTETPSPQGE